MLWKKPSETGFTRNLILCVDVFEYLDYPILLACSYSHAIHFSFERSTIKIMPKDNAKTTNAVKRALSAEGGGELYRRLRASL